MSPTKNMLSCLIIVGVSLVEIALADSIRQDLAFKDNKDASGRAILNDAEGADKTEIQVTCWGLKPRAKYRVLLSECTDATPDYIKLGTLTTDKSGNGALHAHVEGTYPNWFVVVGVVVDRVLAPLGWWDEFPFGCPGPYEGLLLSPLQP